MPCSFRARWCGRLRDPNARLRGPSTWRGKDRPLAMEHVISRSHPGHVHGRGKRSAYKQGLSCGRWPRLVGRRWLACRAALGLGNPPDAFWLAMVRRAVIVRDFDHAVVAATPDACHHSEAIAQNFHTLADGRYLVDIIVTSRLGDVGLCALSTEQVLVWLKHLLHLRCMWGQSLQQHTADFWWSGLLVLARHGRSVVGRAAEAIGRCKLDSGHRVLRHHESPATGDLPTALAGGCETMRELWNSPG